MDEYEDFEDLEDSEESKGKEVGKITRFFDKISVAVIKLSSNLKVGDRIRIRGTTTDFEQDVDSMQVEHENLDEAKAGQEIGMKVSEKVKVNDRVFIV